MVHTLSLYFSLLPNTECLKYFAFKLFSMNKFCYMSITFCRLISVHGFVCIHFLFVKFMTENVCVQRRFKLTLDIFSRSKYLVDVKLSIDMNVAAHSTTLHLYVLY